MSLVGFKAQNHPQQIAKDEIDDRAITRDDFEKLHARFAFTVDVAASTLNARLPRFWTVEDNALEQSWAGERVWCNPPYSRIRDWVVKAWQEYTAVNHPELIVMLLPANRTELSWWQEHVEPFRDRGTAHLRVEFLRGRMRFLKRGQKEIGPNERPPFGCCLLIWSGDNQLHTGRGGDNAEPQTATTQD